MPRAAAGAWPSWRSVPGSAASLSGGAASLSLLVPIVGPHSPTWWVVDTHATLNCVPLPGKGSEQVSETVKTLSPGMTHSVFLGGASL